MNYVWGAMVWHVKSGDGFLQIGKREFSKAHRIWKTHCGTFVKHGSPGTSSPQTHALNGPVCSLCESRGKEAALKEPPKAAPKPVQVTANLAKPPAPVAAPKPGQPRTSRRSKSG